MRLGVATVATAAAHLAGCFPSAALVGRLAGFDPAAGGSGNPGATNALRLGGRGAGIAVLALDAAKGAVPAAAGVALGGRGAGVLLAAAAVSGHVAPVTGGFRGGGKGVATAAGAVAVADPPVALAAALAFAAAAGATRRVSVGSVAAAASVPVAAAALRRPAREVAGWAAVGVVVVARHADNLRRIAAGSEPATSLRGR